MPVALLSRKQAPAENLLASLEQLENFILDYALRRRAQAVDITVRVAATFFRRGEKLEWAPDARDELLERRRAGIGGYWLKRAVECATDSGLIDELRASANPADALDQIAARVFPDWAEEIVDDWMEEGEDALQEWFRRAGGN